MANDDTYSVSYLLGQIDVLKQRLRKRPLCGSVPLAFAQKHALRALAAACDLYLWLSDDQRDALGASHWTGLARGKASDVTGTATAAEIAVRVMPFKMDP